MRYVNASLREGENIHGAFRQTRIEYLDPLLLYIVASFFGAKVLTAVFIFGCFGIWLRRWITEYAVTNRRVIIKTGLIARRTDEINADAVESVWIKQGIVSRIFGFGDTTIEGRGNNVVVMKRVADVLGVKRSIDSAVAGEAVAPKYADNGKRKSGIGGFKILLLVFGAVPVFGFLIAVALMMDYSADEKPALPEKENSAASEPEVQKRREEEKLRAAEQAGGEEKAQAKWERTRTEFERPVAQSDDFAVHRNVFARGAFELVQQEICTKDEIAENGGFVRKSASSKYKHLPVYFITCGNYKTGYRKRYLNVETGQIHQ